MAKRVLITGSLTLCTALLVVLIVIATGNWSHDEHETHTLKKSEDIKVLYEEQYFSSVSEYQQHKKAIIDVIVDGSASNPRDWGPNYPNPVTADNIFWKIFKGDGNITMKHYSGSEANEIDWILGISGPLPSVSSISLVTDMTATSQKVRDRDLSPENENLELVELVYDNSLLDNDTWKPVSSASDYQEPPEGEQYKIIIGYNWHYQSLLRGYAWRYYIPSSSEYDPTPEEQEVLDYIQQKKSELMELPPEVVNLEPPFERD